ncbi:MAG TPA: Rpn family recombination-promoting nuclease/putative transposase [Cerasibacillus sp.]|uniref:Rpn family recombination-promoting nuclease/putative transposase n=1 Tax=Cerasibacillus sp. TaxID=2498711 RepID=UPI002F426AE4
MQATQLRERKVSIYSQAINPPLTLIREKERRQTYTRHDQLFKELIHTFFQEFLEVFFPDIHEAIDFHTITPLSEEVHTDLIEGDTRRLDIVVQVKLKQEDALIIVHIEPQSTTQTDFHERMFQYFSLLYNKYKKPIIPIAVFSYDENWEKDQFTLGLSEFQILTFNFLSLHLRKKNWRDYITSNNPAAAALLSKMGYSEKERIQVKKEFLRMMATMELNPAKQRLIYGFFETYLKLNDEEEEKLMEEVKKMDDAEKILELPISYEERGIKKGIKKGIERGKKEVALEMLNEGLSIEFIAKVTHLDREEIEALRRK